ncbi:ABC transporter permease [Paenibacillus lemnae]|uniref:ABC transporter permease subunit n=1 Tax=Paenibacillus lemnae TaxID=1330551 RepID=A0A848M2F9_PAELE|nr:ABC transporter permease subunit [Paenibacillus lemnae]NMO94746.1 ABC transporter permease subunit [Paenibacillus lemnae]
MKTNLIFHELRQIRRGFLTCLGITLLFILLLLAKADAFVNNPEMESLLAGMPDGLLQTFGIAVDSFSTLEGYLASQVFPYLIVILSSFAAAWAGGSIAKEKDRGSGEYLFSLPYSRSNIFWSKAAAHWILMTLVFTAGSGLVLVLTFSSGQSVDTGNILTMLFAGYLLVLSFMGLGYMLTSWVSSDRTAVGAAAGMAVAAYFLNMLSGSSEWMERISYVSPYRLFDAAEIVRGGALTLAGCIVTLGLYVAGLVTGVQILKRRDIS